MKTLKIWFPDFFTEAHRFPGEGEVLVEELRKFGIYSQLELTDDCSFIFCGSIWKNDKVRETVAQSPSFKSIPIIQYNWDLYPFQLLTLPIYARGGTEFNPQWIEYLTSLKECCEIWVPSKCTITRTEEFTGRSAFVIKSSIRPWETEEVCIGDYAMNAMGRYPDPNLTMPRECCDYIGIPLIEGGRALSWDKYKETVGKCRFMISAIFEASTGGLSLLEGYWHGKPCLLSNSPRHGGVDYFGDRATYFQWDNPQLFMNALRKIYDNPPVVNIDEAREWITREYSEKALARRMANRFWGLYNDGI